jgi:hypothetical protein
MTGKADDALRTYNEIEDIIGINEDVSMQKQRIYMVLNKPDKASAEIENLIDAFRTMLPDIIPYWPRSICRRISRMWRHPITRRSLR